MKKQLLNSIKYYLFFIISILVISQINAQQRRGGEGTGNLIQYEQRIDLQLRGDMQIIGNSILGIRGEFDGENFTPNQEYNRSRNNGDGNRPNRFTAGPIPTRAFIDIDSDQSDDRFSGLFDSNLSETETEYTGETDINGKPVPRGNNDSQDNYTGTFNSSAARLEFDPDCSTVVKAFLYWGGVYTTNGVNANGGTSNAARNLFEPDDSQRESADYTEIKILPPNGTQYYDISKHNLDGSLTTNNPNGLVFQTEVIFDGQENAYFNNNILREQDVQALSDPSLDPANLDPAITTQRRLNVIDRFDFNVDRDLRPGDPTQDRAYTCRADVTELFTSLQNSGQEVSGWWTVANLRATTGIRNRGLAAGWTLAVVYEDANTVNERRIFFYDGFSYISNFDRSRPVSFDVGPFTTDPNANPIMAEIASAGLEGDRGFSGDQLLISTQTTESLGGPRQLEESGSNNNTNFYNSTITSNKINGVFRQPNSSNTLGFDTDQFELDNRENRILNNGRNIQGGSAPFFTDTEATFTLTTSGDSYGNHFVAFAVDIVGPNVTLLKQAFRATNPNTPLLQNEAIDFNEELIYRLTLRNIGNDDATELSITDFIPANTQLITLNGDANVELSNATIRQFFDFDGSVPNENAITIQQSRENAPGSITNFPFETDRIDFSNFPILSEVNCNPCEGPDRTELITIEFRVRVLDECDQDRRACYDQVSNSVQGEFNGRLLQRDPSSLFPIRSANEIDPDCNNNLIEGPTIQLPTIQGRCTSEVGTICEQGGTTDLEGGEGFSRYNLYFYPLAEISDAMGNVIDTNGENGIDDTDYPIDPSRRISSQILSGSPFASTPLFDASEPNVTITNNPQNFSNIANGAGFYIIEAIADPNLGCSDGIETFNVGLFDATLPINRPLENPDLNGVLLPVCTTNNQRMVQFEICEAQFEIPTSYPRDTRLVWSRVNPDNCSGETNLENCPITGPSGCEYIPFKTVEDTVPNDPDTENVTITQTGDYSLTATLQNGGCTETFFFRVIDFTNNLAVTVPTITTCNDSNIVTVEGTSSDGGSQDFRIEYFTNNPATDGDTFTLVETDNPGEEGYARYNVPTPATLPAVVNVRTIITPISPTVIRGTSCVFEFNDPIQFIQPRILDFSLQRAPSCIDDQPDPEPDNTEESKGDLRVEVTDDSEEYTYVLINTNGTTNDESDDIIVRSFNSSNNIDTDNLRNVDPEEEYKIRVYLNGEVPSENDHRLDASTLSNNQCILEEILPAFPAAENFNARINLVRQVSCEPGIIQIVFETPVPTNTTEASFTITDLGIFNEDLNTNIFIQDESLRPETVSEDNVNEGISEDNSTSDRIFYLDLNSVRDFDVVVNINDECSRFIQDIPNPLNVYEGISVVEPIVDEDVTCNGGDNGQFTAMATNLAGGTLQASTTVDFQIISGDNSTVTYPVISTDGNFDSLPAGTYQVVARNISDDANPCVSESVDVEIEQPQPLQAPTIRQESDFICNDTASITVIVGGTGDDATAPIITANTDLGGTRPYRFQLFKDQSTIPESTPGLLVSELPFTGLTNGNYTVGIVDNNGCPLSPLSEVITVDPRSEIDSNSIAEEHDPISCSPNTDIVNPTTEVRVTADVLNDIGSIVNYEVTTANPTDASQANTILGTSAANGIFNLPEGDYEITITTSSECTDTVIVEIEPILQISVTATNPPVPNCIGDTVSVTATVSGFDGRIIQPATTPVGGYTFQLTRNAVEDDTASNSSSVPVVSNSITLTNLLPTTATDFYVLTVTDIVTNCTDEVIINVDAPIAIPTVALDGMPTFVCSSATDGQYQFRVQGSGGNGSTYQFSLEDTDASTPNATADIAFREGETFTVGLPATGSDTYTISVIDDRNCNMPNTTTVTVDAIEPLTASLNTAASNLCATSTTNPNVTIDVSGSPQFSYRLFREGVAVGSTVAVTTVTSSPGSFSLDLPNPSTTTTTDYEIFISDVNHPNVACEVRVPISINPPLTIGDNINENFPNCRASAGALPTAGATTNFTVSGGNGTYNYRVVNSTSGAVLLDTDTSAGVTTAAGVLQTGSNASPTFDFSNDFDGDNIIIEIRDTANTSCPANTTVPFTPIYPILPAVATEVLTPAKCSGDASRFSIGLDFSNFPATTSNNDFIFTFNGNNLGSQNFINNPASGILNYSVEARATGCITTGSVTIQEPTEIIEVARDLVLPSCDNEPTSLTPGATIPGTIRLTVAGGFIDNPNGIISSSNSPTDQLSARYNFIIRELGSTTPLTPTTMPTASNPTIANNGTSTTVEYTDLEPGTYEIESILNDGDTINGNECSERFIVVLPSRPFVNVINTQFNTTDCAAGVDLFIVIDGGADPSNFEILFRSAGFSSNNFIQTDNTDTDFAARFGESDFLDASFLPSGIEVPDLLSFSNRADDDSFDVNDLTLADFTDPPLFLPIPENNNGTFSVAQQNDFIANVESRFFRFTGLPPGGQYQIFVRDIITNCLTEAIIEAPDADNVDVREVRTTNTGSCSPPSGTATVSFNITSALLGDYEIQLQRPGLPDNSNERIVVEVVDPSTPTPLAPGQVTGTLNTSVIPNRIDGIMVTLENLPEILITENANIRVRQIGGSDCSDVLDTPPAPVTIGVDPPIANFEVTSQAGNCETGALLSFSATGGNGSFSYIVVNPTDALPDALTNFPISTPPSESIVIDLNNLDNRIDTSLPPTQAEIDDPDFDQNNFIGRVRVSVRSANCVETTVTPIFFNRPPTLTLGDIIPPNCTSERLPDTINYTIGNFDANQTYQFTVNGTTIIPIDNTSLVITGAAPTESATGTLTVTDGARGYDVVLSGSNNSNCIATANFTIYQDISVTTTTSAVNCDNEFDTITVAVTGGFINPGQTVIPTRELLYELIDVTTNTVIASQETENTTATFTNDAGSILDLQAGVQYQIRVTDRFDPDATTVRESCPLTVDVDEVTPLVVPEFTLAANSVTCPTDSDGGITFTITTNGNTPLPPTFRLYQFNNNTDAMAALTAANTSGDYTMLSGTLVNNPTNDRAYNDLTAVPYVGFLETQGLNCPTPAQLVEVEAPVVPAIADFTVDQNPGVCDNIDRSDDASTLTIAINAVNPSDAAFTYEVTGPNFNINATAITNTIGQVPNLPELPTSLFSDLDYIVTIRNTNQPTCNPLTYTVTVPQCGGIVPPPVTITVDEDDVLCDDTTLGSASFTVAGQPTLDFSYTITGGRAMPSSGTSTTATINLSNLEIGVPYTISVRDRTDPRITDAVTQTFTLDAPEAIIITGDTPSITCASNTPEVTVAYTVANGNGPYTFTLFNDATNSQIGLPVTTTGNSQSFTYSVDGDYRIEVADSNNCTAELEFPINVPDPIAATVNVTNECLPNIEFEIDITSGQASFDYRVFETNATPGAFIENNNNNRIGNNNNTRILDDSSITSAGTYRVEIRDTNSCTTFITPDFVINPQLTATVARMEPVCSPATPPANPQARENGQVTITAAAGSGTYTFQLAELSSATQDPTALFGDPGIVLTPAEVTVLPTSLSFEVSEENRDNFYVVKVTDGNMCEFIRPIRRFDFPETPIASFLKSDIICAGDTGSFTIQTPTVGEGPFTYAIFEGTTRPSPEPADLFNDPAINNTITQTSNVQRTFTYIVRDSNGCESMPQQVTINDNSIQLGSISATPVTCEIIRPARTSTNDNGSITLEILRGRTEFVYTIFNADTNTQVLVPDNLDTTNADGTATTADRTITFTGLEVGNYEIRVIDNEDNDPLTPADGCNSVSFFIEVESASPIDIGPVIYSDCVDSGGSIIALFRISSDNLPFIESPTLGGPPTDPSLTPPMDDVFRYTELTMAQRDLIPFTPTVGTENTYYAITGLPANRAFNLEVIDSVTFCNAVLNLNAEEDLVNITSINVTPDSSCATGSNIVEGELEVTFEVGTSGATLFDVTLLDIDDNLIVTTGGLTNSNPRINQPVGSVLFTGLPVGRYKVRVDEPGGSCGAESEIQELIQAPQLELPRVISTTNASCASFNGTPQLATINVAASGGILFDTANGYEFALVVAGTLQPIPDSAFEDTVSFERDPSISTTWDLYVRDNSSCEPRGPELVTIDINPEPIISVEPFSTNQCDGPSFPIEVTITGYDSSLAPYVFDILRTGTPDIVVANAATLDNSGVDKATVVIPSRGVFDIRVTDVNGCNSIMPVTIYEELMVTTTVGAVECDNTIIGGITANVTGGFTAGPRDILYELFVEGNATPVNTFTQSITATTGASTDSHSFVVDSSANALQAGVRYFVRVTDDFGTAAPVEPICEATSATITTTPIINATPVDLEIIAEIQCDIAPNNTGSIRLNTSTPPASPSPSLPESFELFRFNDEASANTFIANITPPVTPPAQPTAGTLRTGTINTFDNLIAGTYVGFALNNGCYTVFPEPVVLEDPVYVAPNITVTAVSGTCDPLTKGPFIQLEVQDLTTSLNRPYSYRIFEEGGTGGAFITIPGTEEEATLIAGETIIVEVPLAAGDYTVEFRGQSNAICNIPPEVRTPITVADFVIPQIRVERDNTAINGGALSCFTNETVRVFVTGVAGDEFTIEAISLEGPDTITVNPQTNVLIPASGEVAVTFEFTEAGRYEFSAVNPITTCSVTSNPFDIESLDQLQVSVLGSPQISCVGDNDQAITFLVDNHIGFITYELRDTSLLPTDPPVIAATTVEITETTVSDIRTINNEFSTTATLGAGNYELMVTIANDASGTPISTNALCVASASAAVLNAPAQVQFTVSTPTPITCSDEFTIIEATASMGVPPYEYQLTGSDGVPIVDFSINGETAPNTTGFFGTDLLLVADTYTISVRDSNNCEAATPIMVTPEEFITSPTISNVISTEPLCSDETTGTIRVEATLANNLPPTSNRITYTLFTVTGNTQTEIDNREFSSDFTTSNTDHTFTVIAGNAATPNFYVVGVSDEFGCESVISAVQTIEKPEILDFGIPELLIPISCEIRDSSKGETEQIRINAVGGTAPYTIELLERDVDGNRLDPISLLETNNSNGLGIGEFELVPGLNYFRVTDGNNCEAFTVIRVNNAPLPIDFEIIPQQSDRNILCFGETDFVDVDGNVTGGVSGFAYSLVIGTPNASSFTEIETVVNELGDNVNINLPSAVRSGLTRFEGLRSLTTLIANGVYPADATYLYKVTSGSCDPVYRPFEVLERSQIIVEAPEVREPSCFGVQPPDAEVTISIASGDNGEYSIRIIREVNSIFDINVSGVARLLNFRNPTTDDPGNTSVTFSTLLPGNYQLLVSGNNCDLNPIAFTIGDKTPVVVTETAIDAPNCAGDSSSVTYQVSGGTPPYFYRVVDIEALENGDATQEIIFPEIEVWGNPNNVVLASGDTFTITTDNNGDLLKNNNRYQVVVVDSGNERYDLSAAPASYIADTDISGDTLLKVCQPNTPNGFNFEVPDLTGFTAEQRYICETGLYDITVIQPANSTLVRDNITYTLTNITTGSVTTSTGDNVLESIEPGEIVITFDYERPDNNFVCSSLPADNIIQTLEDLPMLEFIRQAVLDENGDPVLDAAGNEVRTGESFELIGLNRYRISAQGGVPPYTYQVTNAQGESLDLEIDLRGRAIFTITESGDYNFSVRDANDCIATSNANDIGFIDIEIPNVFNPSSSNPEVNRWYPDNLTIGDVFPIPNGGIVVEDGVTIITITTGGVTTGGVFTPGQGGRGTITGGTTTQGITVVTTINPDGETSSTVTVTTGGTLVGGITSGTPSFDTNGDTIIVDGTTTGGTLSGGVTSAPVETGTTATPTSTSVIRTTVGNTTTSSTGETTGGIFIETTTMPGPNNTTVTTARVIDLTTGTVTDGTRTGSIVIGGTISGGVPVETNIPVETTTSGGTTINRGDDFIDFANIEVMVFDRYGRLLEQFKGILNDNDGEGWDGTYQGNPMPTGDYWYLIKLNDDRGREISGNFTLYRSK